MNTLEKLLDGYEGRRIVFEIKPGIAVEDTILPIGEAKFVALKAKVNRMKQDPTYPNKDINIMELMTQSRKELRGHAF